MTVRTGTVMPSQDVAVFQPSTRTRGSFGVATTIDVATFHPSSRCRNGAWFRGFNAGWLPDLECPMSIIPVLQNTATKISVFMRDSSTGVGKPGLTLVVALKKSNQVTLSGIAPAQTDVGSGWYDLALTTAHVDTIGKAPLSISATNAMTRNDICLDVIAWDFFSTAIPVAPTAAAVRDAILDAARSSHVATGTVGEGIAIATSLLQGNFYMDQVVSGVNGQTSARMRCFNSAISAAAATSGGTGEGEFATFVVSTSYSAPGVIIDHRVVQQ